MVGLVLVALGGTAAQHPALPRDYAIRPGLWQSVALDASGRPDPGSLEEICVAERTWSGIIGLSAGSREMGCAPMERIMVRGPGGPIPAAREVCRQGRVTVTRLVRLRPRSPISRPLESFDETTVLSVGSRVIETSRVRRKWRGLCPDNHGALLGESDR